MTYSHAKNTIPMMREISYYILGGTYYEMVQQGNHLEGLRNFVFGIVADNGIGLRGDGVQTRHIP